MVGPPAICHVVSGDGTRIAYHVLGAGPPLVLLFPYHVNDLIRNWSVPAHREAIRDLARHFTVINLDLRGAGQSERTPSAVTLDLLCGDVLAVLGDVGFDRTGVLAIGSTALVAARLSASFPAAVSALVLLGAGESDPSDRLLRLRGVSPTVGSDVRASAVVGLADHENVTALAEVIREATSSASFAAYDCLLRATTVADALRAASTPSLLVHASQDELVPLAAAHRICSAMPAAHLLTVTAPSHFAVWQDELAVSRIVAFLNGTWSGAEHDMPTQAGATSRPVGRSRALTQREREVLRLVAAGRTNGQIRAELFISLNTVSHHLRAIFAKTDSANRTEAAAFAHRHGLAK